MSGGDDVLLEVRNLSKAFPGQVALSGVDLNVRAGEVHAIVGENGSGKSTLIKVLAGYHQPDAGSVVELASSASGPTAIGFVHQDLALVEGMSALDNLAFGRKFATKWGGIDTAKELERATSLMERLGRQIDLTVPLAELQPVERALVAMARALDGLGERAVLVLDEPTAALPAPEVGRLFRAIEEVKSEGGGVLYVSHRLDEVFEVADRVTVLRDGRRVATVEAGELDHEGLIELMLGHSLEAGFDQDVREPRGGVALGVRGLSGGTVKDFSADVLAGEIVGVAGLAGSGREDLARALVGALPGTTGTVNVDGSVLRRRNPRAAIDAGLALVPRDRARYGAILEHSVAENVTLPQLKPLLRRMRIHRRRELADVQGWIQRVDIRPADPEMVLGAMSGGNQQKAVLARWLRARPRVLLLDEPTQGVDVGAKAAIHKLLREAASEGLALLVCSAETEDLVDLCDRVLVMRAGRVEVELKREELTNSRIVKESLGIARRIGQTARPGSGIAA